MEELGKISKTTSLGDKIKIIETLVNVSRLEDVERMLYIFKSFADEKFNNNEEWGDILDLGPGWKTVTLGSKMKNK